MRNEEESLSSPPLQTLQNLELESGGFNMFLGFKEIEDQINMQGLSPFSRRQDYKNHSLHPFQADMHRPACQNDQT